MNSVQTSIVDPKNVGRRVILQGAVWSIPVVALATAAPAAAASGTTEPSGLGCIVDPSATFTMSSPLYIDGRTGVLAGGAPAFYGAPTRTTGWTPVDSADPYSIDGTWWNPTAGATTVDVNSALGFMSQDDYNNSVDPGPNPPVNTVSLTLSIQATANTPYQLALPVYGGSDQNGAQFLDISVSGPGVAQTILQGYRGIKAVSTYPASFDSHTVIPDFNTYMANFTPTADGVVTVTYTFTLVYVHGGTKQNADIYVGAPYVSNCE